MATEQQKEVIALDLPDIDRAKLIPGPLNRKTSPYKLPTGGWGQKKTAFLELYYGEVGNKFTFTLQDLFTHGGIKTLPQYNMLLMGCNLSEEQSAAIKRAVDGAIVQVLFDNRAQFGGKLAEAKTLEMFSMCYEGVVKNGEPRTDGQPGNFPDSLCATVASRKTKAGIEPLRPDEIADRNNVRVEWDQVSKELAEVCIQVDRINLKDGILEVRCVYRGITPNKMSEPRVMSKRRAQALKPKAITDKPQQVVDAAAANKRPKITAGPGPDK